MNALTDRLVQRLAEPLPGREAQFRMASSFRAPQGYVPDLSTARMGGVLIALFEDEGVVRTVLMKRPDYDGTHSGQVSFPGGKKELGDADIVATALREAYEEVAMPTMDVEVIGQLTELYIPASNFLVHPVVGILRQVPILKPDVREVESILLPPVAHFFRPEIIGEKSVRVRNDLMIRAPYYDVDGHTVWGATAMILSELMQVMEDVGFAQKV